MEKPPSRFPLYLGALLIACGWIVLYLGWEQAGRQEIETGQIPYLLSGGFGGLGLLLLGVAGVLIDAIGRSGAAQRQAAEGTQRALERAVEALERLEEQAERAREAERPAQAPAVRSSGTRRGGGGRSTSKSTGSRARSRS